MPKPENLGIAYGFMVGEKVRHYRRELKSGGISAVALCGVNPMHNKTHWIQNLNDAHAETRMDYPICKDCDREAHSS